MSKMGVPDEERRQIEADASVAARLSFGDIVSTSLLRRAQGMPDVQVIVVQSNSGPMSAENMTMGNHGNVPAELMALLPEILARGFGHSQPS